MRSRPSRTAYAQAITEQLIAHDALPKGSQVLAISKDDDALSLDLNEAFLAGLRQSGSTGELMYHRQSGQHVPR
ncbi:MAG: hypothetical protein ACLUNO_10970 [Oscillospiraceae bacterium]